MDLTPNELIMINRYENELEAGNIKGITLDEDLWCEYMTETIEEQCKQYQFKTKLFADRIYIYTKFDSWYFTITPGKIRLMHENSRMAKYTKDVHSYHEQFRKYITPSDIVQYIYEHTQAKYGSEFICFSIS